MDRNSAIGLTLIAVLLLVYFNFFAPAPIPEEKKPATVSTVDTAKKDTTKAIVAVDSSLIKQYGDLSSFLTGTEETTTVENDQVRYQFSNSGVIKEV